MIDLILLGIVLLCLTLLACFWQSHPDEVDEVEDLEEVRSIEPCFDFTPPESQRPRYITPGAESILSLAEGMPRERGKRKISRGENICRATLESIYGVPFTTQRPDFLTNPETGAALELDCYNSELAIAVEYNGEQHYRWPNGFPMTREQFINQARRDTLKRELCDSHGVYLIVVPYNVPHEMIPGYISYYLDEERMRGN